MKFELMIATTNKHKHRVISSIVKSIYSDITIIKKKIPDSNISPESSNKARENVKQKALFYGKLFKKNVLCEDDTLLINKKETFIHRYNDKLQTKKEIYNYWFNILKNEGPIKGKLIKAYAFNKNNKIFTDQVEKEIKLTLPKVKINKLSYNPLNYFIVPKGYSISINELSEGQLVKFRKQETILLKNLLRK